MSTNLQKLEEEDVAHRLARQPTAQAILITMLGNGKIDSLDTHLEQFKLNNQTNQRNLESILKEYSQLLDSYKALRKAYDEKGVKKVDNFPSEKARNPYILVLIDGNGYIFNDELIRDKEEGGMRAARMLHDAVEKYIRESLPEGRDPRVIVRIYADLTNLSKQLAKSKLTGLEKRSLAPFAAGFTRAFNLFDFTDALDEEGTKFKIRETFKIAAEDSACSHILYAACHDASYLPQLVPYSGLRNKISLVQGAGFSPDFYQFSLDVTQFPTIFKWSELHSGPSTKSSKSSTINLADRIATPLRTRIDARHSTPKSSVLRNDDLWVRHSITADTGFGSDDMSPVSNGFTDNDATAWESKHDKKQKSSQTMCKYFQKGFCRYGNKCNFQHALNGLGLTQQDQSLNGVKMDRSNIASQLPTTTVPGFIPLNKDNQRLDAHIRAPTQEEWAIYNGRFRKQKPCNSFHLQRVCTTFGCPYDHNELEPEARHALEYVLKCQSCPRKGACRASDCFYGHLCQKDDCIGQMKGCKMRTDLHKVDPKLKSMVPAEDQLVHEDNLDITDEMNGMW